MIEESKERSLTLIYSLRQLGALKMNTGWGDFLSSEAGSGLNASDISSFYGFLNAACPQKEETEEIVLEGEHEPLLRGRLDVFELPAEVLESQLARFRLLKLIDPEWARHPEVALVFASPKDLSSERMEVLTKTARVFQPEIPFEDKEGVSVWTTVLLTKGIVGASYEDKRARVVKMGLLKESFRGDPFVLTKGETGVALGVIAAGRGEEWRSEARNDNSFLWFPYDPDQSGGIGRCCFTVKILSRGLETERESRAVVQKREGAEATVVKTGKVEIAKIVYDQYPASDYSVCMTIKEVDVAKQAPRVEVAAKVGLKAHLKARNSNRK